MDEYKYSEARTLGVGSWVRRKAKEAANFCKESIHKIDFAC
jgi:hypothetical protein